MRATSCFSLMLFAAVLLPQDAGACPCPEQAADSLAVVRARGGSVFWGIVNKLEYGEEQTVATMSVDAVYSVHEMGDVATVELTTDRCAPEIQKGIGFLAAVMPQADGKLRVANCGPSGIQRFPRAQARETATPDLRAVRMELTRVVTESVEHAIATCFPERPPRRAHVELLLFSDGSVSVRTGAMDGTDRHCVPRLLLDQFQPPERHEYPISVTASTSGRSVATLDFRVVPRDKGSRSRLLRSLAAAPDIVAPSARMLKVDRQLAEGDIMAAVLNTCLAEGFVEAEALLEVHKGARQVELEQLFGCAAMHDDISGMRRSLAAGESDLSDLVLSDVLGRLNERPSLEQPLEDVTKSALERHAILAWARANEGWADSALLLQIIAEAASMVPDGPRQPSAVAAMAYHRVSLMRPDMQAFVERSKAAMTGGELNPRRLSELTDVFARTEKSRKELEFVAADALLHGVQDVEPNAAASVVDEPPEASDDAQQAEPDEGLVGPAWCGFAALVLLLLIGRAARRGLTSPS